MGQKKAPEDWKKGLIAKVPKKGDLSNCNNWRGITLLSVVSKVFSRCILKRFQIKVDETLRKEQAGFRPGRSCSDQIFMLRTVIEESLEYNAPYTSTSWILRRHSTVFTEKVYGKS